RRDPVEHQRQRLQVGLERNISLVVAKAAIVLVEADPTGVDAFRAGIDFGVRRRGGGWFRGLTTLTCFMNLVPRLPAEERAAALYHGLTDVALDVAGWERAEAVLASLPAQLAFAERMEEANAWRHPVDLVALLEDAFERLPEPGPGSWEGRAELVETILAAEAAEILEALLQALRDGASAVELASAVTYAAAMRIARFPTTNEFGDW